MVHQGLSPLEAALAARGVKLEYAVVSNPEFLREGSAVDDFLKPDRVVVGADDRAAAIAVGSLYDKVREQMAFTFVATMDEVLHLALLPVVPAASGEAGAPRYARITGTGSVDEITARVMAALGA